MKITLKQLEEAGACKEELELFEKFFGIEVEVTSKLCAKYAKIFSWRWAARHLLSAAAQKIYNEDIARTLKVYNKVISLAWKGCDKIKMQAYVEITEQAWKTFVETKAYAFCKAYNFKEGIS